ncbi:MAG: hypothetical protein JWM98_155 [Thermoleophilia bacterium]|nr:hypothetical protein [Thermoleophilia bacterium]
MRRIHLTQLIGAVAVLALAVAGGWAATNLFQRTVPIVPGVQGCWRLEGSARQVTCLSDEFSSGADEAAGDASGADRDRAVIAYVRRAERLAAGDPRLAATCHPSMHALGRREGARAAREGRAPTFPGGSSQLCTAGYVHGLSEGYLEHTDAADVAPVFAKLCHDVKARSGCAHGVGHAFVRGQAHAPAASAARAANAHCDDLPGAYPVNCSDGVYMELAMRTQPSAVPVAEYRRACEDAGSAGHELACWGYLDLDLTSNDVPIEDVPAQCLKASVPGQFTCIDGYGRNLGVAGVPKCGQLDARVALQQRCVEGAIGLQVGSGHVTGAAARARCRSVRPASLARYCASAVSRYLGGKAAVEAA